MPSRRFVHLIGNAHIDPVWLWHWTEGYQEVRATFSSALDRMTEYPDFVFTANQIVFLTWVAEHDRPLFARIKARVLEGRFEVVGGMWVEPDCNLPSGESVVRQLLYSQRFLHREFGRIATVGLNADPFGHAASLPQILTQAGIDSYLFLRPQAHEMTMPPGPFWWQGPDGSRVLATRIPNEYCSPPGEVTHVVAKALAQLPVTDTPMVCFYGVGNHGGGPTRANIDSIHQLAARDLLPRLGMSTLRKYVNAVLEDVTGLPTVAGELQPHAVGCYSAMAAVKQNNRRCENLLASAETWAAAARTIDDEAPDPRADLESGWTTLLFNQFHDILPGSALPDTYVDTRDQHGLVATVAGRVANRSIQSISRRIDIPFATDEFPLVVFNPHGGPLSDVVEMEYSAFAGPFELVDEQGRATPVQPVRSRALTAGRGRMVFAVEVPALGYRLYRLRVAAIPPPDRTDAPLVLDNGRIRAVIDADNGWLAELRMAGGPNLVRPGAAHAVVLDDDTDTWSHGVRSFRRAAGVFAPVRVERIESGPVRQAVRVISRYGASQLVEEIRLAAAADYLEVLVTLDWRERHALLKLRMPTSIAAAQASFEIPYGHVSRPVDGEEVPGQRWVDVSGDVDGVRAGMALVNDGKYAFDAKSEGGVDVGTSVARSPIFAWHDPAVPAEDELYAYQDQGEQRFRYRIVPHDGDWRAAGVIGVAAALNQQPTALFESAHPGPLPPVRSFGGVESDSVLITAVKPAEDDPGAVVVRAHETAGRATTATLTWAGRSVTLPFAAYQLRTLLFPAGGSDPVPVDLLERPIAADAG